MVALLVGGDGYALGQKVETWSLDDSCSKDLPDLSMARSHHVTLVLDNQILSCGGTNSNVSSNCVFLDQDLQWKHHSDLNLGWSS